MRYRFTGRSVISSVTVRPQAATNFWYGSKVSGWKKQFGSCASIPATIVLPQALAMRKKRSEG